jgi:hypothetical protein
LTRVASIICGDLAGRSWRAAPQRAVSAPAARTHFAAEEMSDLGRPSGGCVVKLKRREFLVCLSAPALARAPALAQNTKPRLARKDSFFGLHFDLHPQATDTALGRDVTEEMIERLLARARPDYVQYDCKGHAGYLGYRSRVGTSSPGIVNDSLELWRRVTARNGVALYIHFSGLWDSLAIRQHPEWACVHDDGSLDPNATSTFGPYVDELMIPELKEVAAKYDLDGAWVDGECWAVKPDYCKRAAEAFAAATGIRDLPRGPSDPGWMEFLDFNRAQFRNYVAHYVDEVHRYRPAFQIASNWLYTTFVPEQPRIPVDFVSGDYLGNASISTARLEARYLSSIDKPWDLMAWGFQQGGGPKPGYTHKPAVQLQQESAVVLAQGGGFQVYFQPTRAGRLDDPLIGVMENVSRFCRDRQALCHKSRTVPQIGLVFSQGSLYRTSNRMFGGWGSLTAPARGFIDAFVENGFSVDVLPEWKLESVIRDYPLVVIPDWPDIGLKVKDLVAGYVRAGGKALVAGAENVALFSDELRVRLTGDAADQVTYVRGDEVFANAHGLWQPIEPAGAKLLEERYPTFDSTRDAACAATLSSLGSGQIAAVAGPVGAIFADTHAPAIREFVRRIVRSIFSPLVRLQGPPTIEMALRTKEGRLLVHLLNSTGMQVSSEYVAGDFVPPVGPVRVEVRLAKAPRRATLEPGGRLLTGRHADGTWTATIDRIDIHEIISIDE